MCDGSFATYSHTNGMETTLTQSRPRSGQTLEDNCRQSGHESFERDQAAEVVLIQSGETGNPFHNLYTQANMRTDES